MDKPFIVTLIVGGIVIAGLGVAVKVLHSDLKASENALALKTRELKETKGDVDVSKQNSDRMLAEKDIALDAAEDRANEQIERAGQFARISKEIAHASVPSEGQKPACADSPAIDAALRGLRNLQRAAGGDLQTDGRVPAGEDPGKPAEVQRTADHP